MARGVYERKDSPTVTEKAAEELVGRDPSHRTKPSEPKPVVPGFTYMALKPMKIAGELIQPGTVVDAASWRNVHNYVSAGYLAVVSSDK